MSTPEQLRLDHFAAEASTREAAVPAPSPQPSVPDHAAGMLAAHGCTPPPPGVTPSSGG